MSGTRLGAPRSRRSNRSSAILQSLLALRPRVGAFFCLLLGTFFFAHHAAAETQLAQKLAATLRLGNGVGAVVQEIGGRGYVFAHNEHAPLKPASVLKIATSYAALRELGGNFRFETEVFLSGKGPESTLYVKGGGSPDLSIEQAWMMARQLKVQGVTEIGRIVLDQSLFRSPNRRAGQRAYETGGGALSFNYNSISISVCPQEPGKSAIVTIDPWEAGLGLQGMIATGSKDAFRVDETPEGFAIRGTVARSGGCRTVYRSVEDPLAVFGAVFKALLQQMGVRGALTVERGAVAPQARKLFTEGSKPLALIVRDLNHYSNNFIAEQVLHGISRQGNAPWDRDRGLARLTQLLTFGEVPAVVVDGSGLDHANRATAASLLHVLQLAAQDPQIGPEFFASLSKNGESGTLKKRQLGLPDGVIRAKTGTLRDTVSLAGYVSAKSGKTYAFVTLHNGRATQSAYTDESKLVQSIYNFG